MVLSVSAIFDVQPALSSRSPLAVALCRRHLLVLLYYADQTSQSEEPRVPERRWALDMLRCCLSWGDLAGVRVGQQQRFGERHDGKGGETLIGQPTVSSCTASRQGNTCWWREGHTADQRRVEDRTDMFPTRLLGFCVGCVCPHLDYIHKSKAAGGMFSATGTKGIFVGWMK